MPKLKGPLFSVTAGGKLGDAICYEGSKSGPRVQKNPTHRDMQTGAQITHRALFCEAVSAWHALSGASKAYYTTLAQGQGMTGYNLFVKQYIIAGYVPLTAPSNLDAKDPTWETIDLTWTKGPGSDKTMIRRKEGSYPTGPTDGDQAYFDTGESTTDTGLDELTEYFYRAWAEKNGEYSDGYSSDSETTTEAPSPLWSDDFNRADGPMGSNWQKTVNPVYATMYVKDQYAHGYYTDPPGMGRWYEYKYRFATYGNVRLQVDARIPSPIAATDWIGLAMRRDYDDDTMNDSGYTIKVRLDGQLEGFNITNGTEVLAQIGSINWDVYHELRVLCDGYDFDVYWDGDFIATYSPAAQSWGSGYAGLAGYATNGSGYFEFRCDDFEVWEL